MPHFHDEYGTSPPTHLIAGAIATVDDYSKLLGDVGTLMASYFTTFTVQGRRLF